MTTPEAEAEVETTPEVEAESTSEPEFSTSEPEFATSEPEVEVETEPEGEYYSGRAFSDPEPEPNWPVAFQKWGSVWQLHVYAFACLFLLIAILTLISMKVYVVDRRRLKQGKLTFTLQCLLLLFTLLRALSLFINPYQTIDMDILTFDIIWSLALPGLTASFSVLLLVFLDTTKMTLGPPMFQRLSVLLSFTACHFFIVMISDVVCYVGKVCKPMLLFCQILFILYGALLCAGYSYIAVTLFKRSSSVATVVNGEDNKKIMRLIRISAMAAGISFSYTVTYIYLAAGDFGMYSDVTYVKAWDWMILQSIIRLEELSSACLILVIAFRNPFEGNQAFARCLAKCCPGNPTVDSGTTSMTITKSNKVVPHTDATTCVSTAPPIEKRKL